MFRCLMIVSISVLLNTVCATPFTTEPAKELEYSWMPGMPRTSSTSAQLDVKPDAMTPSKRQVPILKKALAGTWEYVCPLGGLGTKVFKWYAVADVPHNSVTVTNMWNIDSWGDLQIIDHSFHAYFYHGYCQQIGRYACMYKFRGKTTGWVDRYGIHMGMITHSTDGSENPRVEEECVDTGGPHEGTHHTCPAIVEALFSRCIVTRADAIYIPPP